MLNCLLKVEFESWYICEMCSSLDIGGLLIVMIYLCGYFIFVEGKKVIFWGLIWFI